MARVVVAIIILLVLGVIMLGVGIGLTVAVPNVFVGGIILLSFGGAALTIALITLLGYCLGVI